MVKRFDAERPVESFKALLVDLLKGYSFEVVGLHLKDGTVLPLPADPRVLRTILQASLVDYLDRQVRRIAELGFTITSRWGCLQIVFSGSLLSSDSVVVEVKCTRRSEQRVSIRSAISLAAPRAASRMTPRGPQQSGEGLMIVVAYDHVEGAIRDVELIVAEKWRVARRSSRRVASRRVFAVRNLRRLREERGDFEDEQEFRVFVHGLEGGPSDRYRATAGAGGGR